MAFEDGFPWPCRPIGEMLETNIDYRGKTPPKSPTGIPTLTAGNVKNGKIDMTKVSFVSEETYKRWTTRGFPEPGDVLISLEAPVGEVASFPGDQTYLITRRIIALRGKKDELDNDFLKYSLLCPFNRDRLLTLSRGTTVERILKTDLTDFKIPAPSIKEQRAIASILGALDDKIELNRRMNATLESLARAIFKSWFVDFDPVQMKAERRSQQAEEKSSFSLPPSTLKLCPSTFQDSELGDIPDGWSVQSLAEMSELLSGGTPKKSIDHYWNGDLPWISPKAMMTLHAFDSNDHVTEEAVGNGTRLVPKGTVLVMVRGMGLHQGVRISQARRDVTFNQDVKSLVPTTVHGDFLLFAMLDAGPYLFGKVQASGHGTGVIPTDILQSLRFAAPPEDILEKLTPSLTNINDRIHANTMESLTLSALRDTLLPRLLSGELPVPAALTATEGALS